LETGSGQVICGGSIITRRRRESALATPQPVLDHPERPDQINVLSALAELGEIEIADFIYQAMWEKMERNGELDRYRKEYGLSEDWPFDEEDQDEHS
jgi:hypothetical protein